MAIFVEMKEAPTARGKVGLMNLRNKIDEILRFVKVMAKVYVDNKMIVEEVNICQCRINF